MNENRSMAGWIGFASMLLLLVGVIDFFQGLIAVFEDDYYVVTKSTVAALVRYLRSGTPQTWDKAKGTR